MEKVIDGKIYKEVKINKMVINGEERDGYIIPAEDAAKGNDMTVTIYTDDPEEKNVNE